MPTPPSRLRSTLRRSADTVDPGMASARPRVRRSVSTIAPRDPLPDARVGHEQQIRRHEHPIAEQVAVQREPAGSSDLPGEQPAGDSPALMGLPLLPNLLSQGDEQYPRTQPAYEFDKHGSVPRAARQPATPVLSCAGKWASVRLSCACAGSSYAWIHQPRFWTCPWAPFWQTRRRRLPESEFSSVRQVP